MDETENVKPDFLDDDHLSLITDEGPVYDIAKPDIAKPDIVDALEDNNAQRVQALAQGKYGFPVQYPLDLVVLRQYLEHLLDIQGELIWARSRAQNFIAKSLDALERQLQGGGGIVRVAPGTDVSKLVGK